MALGWLMMTVEECLMKAEDYATAAQLVEPAEARVLIRAAAIWRNKALRLKIEQRRLAHIPPEMRPQPYIL
jgi:hypothetical protein